MKSGIHPPNWTLVFRFRNLLILMLVATVGLSEAKPPFWELYHPSGKPGDPIQPAPKAVTAATVSSGLIPNHTYHPAIIHFPIGLFLFGVLMEFFGLRKKNPDFGKVAQWNLQGALCSMGLVVPTGVAAWLRGAHKLEGPMFRMNG